MHCLFVSSLLPEPEPTTGFEIANHAIVEAYRAAGARLTIAGFRRPHGGRTPLEHEIVLGEMEIENAAVGPSQKARWLARALRLGLPVAAAKLRVLSQDALLARLAQAGPFDAVIVNGAQVATAFPALLSLAPAIFVAHNVEHLSAQQIARGAGRAAERLIYRREARLLERSEAQVCAEARIVHTLAGADARLLGLEGDPRLIPLSLWIGRETRAATPERERDVGMIGTWSWAPNRAGLDWFLREVAPHLPSDVRVEIAGNIGRAPPAPSGVRFVGRVPDAQRFVTSSRVVALATTAGTGVQLKTIETLEEGMPAVATPAALRGIETALPSNVEVAQDAADFARALVEAVRRDRDGEPTRLDGSHFAAGQRDASVRAAGAAMAAVASPAKRGEGTAPQVALVTASYKGDLERCRLLCDSIDRHVRGHTCHYILVEEADRALFSGLAGPRRRVVSERELFPGWLRAMPDPTDRTRRIWVHPFGLPLRGWHTQQLRRMAFGRRMAEDAMLSIDSDVVFLRPFDAATVVREGAVRFYRVPGGLLDVSDGQKQNHSDWSREAGRLLGIEPGQSDSQGYINTLIAWRADSVRAMMDRIESVTGRSAMRALAGTRKLSECTIYGRFVSQVEGRPERYWGTSEPLAQIYWSGAAMDRSELQRFIERLDPACVAIGVQSFTGTAPALIRSAAGLA